MNLLDEIKGASPFSKDKHGNPVYLSGDNFIIVAKNKFAKPIGAEYPVKVSIENYTEWRAGALAQTAMASLSKEDREVIISGITPADWNELFESEEDE